MEFRLIYEGILPGQGARSEHKWAIRRALHPQLQRLWEQEPLRAAAAAWLAWPAPATGTSVVFERGPVLLAPLVTSRLNLHAEVDILLFRRQARGALISNEGDLDNRLKTLVDGLRAPRVAQEARLAAIGDEVPSPFYCLLEDDSLITRIGLESEQLLLPGSPDEVFVVITVKVKKTVGTYDNLAL